MSNPYVRETGSVETVHGQKVAIGVDYDAVTVNGLQLGPEVRDDFARLYFLADAEAKAWAAAHPDDDAGQAPPAAELPARAFPIYARFAHPGNGYKGDQEQAARYLVPGRTYLIDHMDVGRSRTTIYLHDFRDTGFNSVLFAAGTEDEWAEAERRAEAHGAVSG